jgi:hypothetical protein
MPPPPLAANLIGESVRGEDVVRGVDDMNTHHAQGHQSYGRIKCLLRCVIGRVLNMPRPNLSLNEKAHSSTWLAT